LGELLLRQEAAKTQLFENHRGVPWSVNQDHALVSGLAVMKTTRHLRDSNPTGGDFWMDERRNVASAA
jgi:hypothetical protein